MQNKKVIIKWVDSRQIHGWTLDTDVDDTCCSIESCGFLVRETEDAYTVHSARATILCNGAELT